MKIFYKIESANEINGEMFGGKVKEIPEDRKNREYYVHFASVGRGAILVHADDETKALVTSKVENIKIWSQGLIITTKNTVYYLKPITKGE